MFLIKRHGLQSVLRIVYVSSSSVSACSRGLTFKIAFNRFFIRIPVGRLPTAGTANLIFKVTDGNQRENMAMIQNRTITFGSGHPFNSKW
jgi:hypothetical protein